MQKKKFNKVVYITLCVLLLFNLFPIKAYAHNAYYLQVLIDENTMTYAGNVVKDNAKKFGTENSHIGVKIYDSYDDNVNKFTFPPYEIGGEKFSHRAENDVSSKEIEKAFEIRDILIPTINDGILILNDGERPNTVEELQNLANMLSNKTIDSEGFIDVDGYKLKASIKKGYSDDAKINRGFSYSLSKDEDTITIKDIINQGNVAAEKGYYSANTEELNKPSSIEIKISNLITSFVNGLRSLLGLFSMNDLVYNQGIRGTKLYHYGTMTEEWLKNAIGFHLIFQAMAWSVMTLAILKMLIQRNVATINVSLKINLMEGVKDIFLTGFLLASIYLIINTLIVINSKIVEVFATTTIDYGGFGSINNDYQTIAGGFLQIFYLFITIYLNAVYVVRGITLAVLIGSAPLFVMAIAFEGKRKQLFTGWMKELVANIFIQSFHAFILSLFLTSQTSARGIENVIMALTLIPLTNMFKQLVTGHSGDLISNVGTSTMNKAMSATGAVVGGITGSFMGGRHGNNKGKANSYNNASYSNETSEASNIGRKDYSAQAPSREESREALNTRMKDYNVNNKDYENINVKTNDKIEELSNKANIDIDSQMERLSNKANIGGATSKDVIKNVGVGAAKTVTGTASVAAGAVGAMIPGFERAGGMMVSKGVGNIKEGIGQGIHGFSQVDKIISDSKNRDIGGNIIGVERRDNGDTLIHRDKGMLNDLGINSIHSDNGVATYSYNMNKLSDKDKKNVNEITNLYGQKKIDYLKERGVVGVGKDANDNVFVQYNKHAQNILGYKDIEQRGNRIIETKSNEHDTKTSLTYDIINAPKSPPYYAGGSSN